jgi:hypothetical protein
MGNRVPGRLAGIFFGRRELADWCNRLGVLRGELASFADEPFAKHLPWEELKEQLDAIQTEVQMATPYALCDCRAREQNCPKCHGDRWISGRQSRKASPLKQV